MRPFRPRGVSLIEALIALLLLAVTLLGAAGGFVHALRSSHSALLHSRAQYLVADLAERIRSNPQAGAAYVVSGTGSGAAPDCDPAPCSAAARAASDLRRWRLAVAAALTDAATATLSYLPGSPDRYRIELRWRDPAGPAEASLAVQVEVAT